MAVNLIYRAMPTVALRGIVIFPDMRLHFEVGRKKSIAAIKAAMDDNQKIFLVTQRDVTDENPTQKQLYTMGIVANIKQVIKSPENKTIRVVVEGICRASITEVLESENYFICNVRERKSKKVAASQKDYADAMVRKAKDVFEKYVEVSSKQAHDVAMEVFYSDDAAHLSDFIAGNAINNYENRQMILEELNPVKRLEKICVLLSKEIDILSIEEKIQSRVQSQVDKNQQEYYLREQMKAISLELNDGDETASEVEQYKKKILSFEFEKQIEEKLLRECDKLEKMQSNSPDANVIRNYLDVCVKLPWNVYTDDNFDLSRARKILDEDHSGLEKVKERFIEMLAVRANTKDIKGQIICLVGPPGVGKTSIVRSVAKAMGRKYVRMSLGGVRDEAEIRGHRKTYIGAMPGRIISSIDQAGSFNPIILLDEVDKLGNDYRGDPSAALLEALDPEQNNTFRDNYMEFPVDLSKVLFITTANDSGTIPAPLYDRMEVIELTSYTLEEKFEIAKNHLIKKEEKAHGLNGRNIRFTDDSIRFLINFYTREAGVRRLEQLLATICRKSLVLLNDTGAKRVTVTDDVIKEMLGPEKFRDDEIDNQDMVGVVNGLAWTSVGGELLQVEAVLMDGSGKLELTGSLGDVMKESAKAAHSFLRSVADEYGIDKELFKTKDIHIHVPQGAVPKDGPSAGVTIATAMLSALTGKKVRHSVAMTGEITLTGRVLPIGGLKEKSMAAYKYSMKKVLIPSGNKSDLWEIDKAVKDNVEFISNERLTEVFRQAIIDFNKKNFVSEKVSTSVKIDQKKSASKNIAQ